MDKKDSNAREVTIIKKNIHFINAANGIAIFAIIFFIAAVFVWRWVINKELTAPLVIQSDGTIDPQKYQSGQKNLTYQTSGYNYAAIGQPCVQEHNQAAVANLPSAYQTPGCNETDRKICVEKLVKGGGICLSALGGVCKSLYDCAPGQGITNCINNVCVNVLEMDTINQPCITDMGCQEFGQNHVCDPQLKICKVNYFPYETGCLVDQDCLSDTQNNKNACINIDSEGLEITGTFLALQTGNYFMISNQDNIAYFGKNMSVSIIDDQKNYSVYRLTSNLINISSGNDQGFKVVYVSGPPLATGSRVSILLGNTGGQKVGICVSRIPQGGKVFQIAGVDIPCEAKLNNIGGFCVFNTSFSGQGVICDRRGTVSTLRCDPSQTQNYIIRTDGIKQTLKLECLGNISITQKFSQNFNYTYPSLIGEDSTQFTDEIPFLGYCNFPVIGHLGYCDPEINNCAKPYLCLSGKDDDGETFNYCGLDYNRQECFVTGDCGDGYSCVDQVCASDPGNICIGFDDCDTSTSSGCNTNSSYLYYYSLTEDKYQQILVIPTTFATDLEIRYNQAVINDPDSPFKDLPTKLLVWRVNTDTTINTSPSLNTMNGYTGVTNSYIGDQAQLILYTYSSSSKTYTRSETTINLYPDTGTSDYQKNFFVDFLFNSSDQVYAIYRKESEADRIRKSTITNYNQSLNQFNMSINTGFADGDPVVYRGGQMFDLDQLYYVRVLTNSPSGITNWSSEQFYLSTTPTGSAVAIQNVSQPYGQIWSTSKIYNIQIPQQSQAEYKIALMASTLENGDTLTLQTDRTLNVNSNSLQGETLFVQKVSNIEGGQFGIDDLQFEETFFYQLTQTYQQSQGSVPFINNTRTPVQEIYVASPSTGYQTLTANQGKVNYSISLVDFSQLEQFIVKDENYVRGHLNGLNSSMSYNFDSSSDNTLDLQDSGDDVSFSLTSSSSGDDYMFLKKNLVCGINNDQQFPLVQRFKVSVTTTKPSDMDSVYLETKMFMGTSATTTYFVLDYDLTSCPPLPQGLYSNGNVVAKNQLEQVQPSPNFSDLRMSISSSYINSQNVDTNTSPTTVVVSEQVKTNYTLDGRNRPSLVYQVDSSTTIEADAIDIEIINVEQFDGTSRKNTYQVGSGLMTFRDQNDIDTVLKYGSSEIVFVKDIGQLTPDPTPNGIDFQDNIFTWGNITMVVTDISSYEADLDGEILILQMNVPLIIDQGARQSILNTGDSWKMYVNNVYPVYYTNIYMEKSSGAQDSLSNLYNFFDASGFYTSTKTKDFFDSDTDYRPTSYNKLYSNINALNTKDNAIYINDGYGVLPSNSNNYDSTQLIDSSSGAILPNLIEYQGLSTLQVQNPTTTYPLTSLRQKGDIFGYFYPFTSINIVNKFTGTYTEDVFGGPSFIRRPGDYTGLGTIDPNNLFSYFRPINSGIIRTTQANLGAGTAYAVNNLYMSTLPRSFPGEPLFNTRPISQNLSVYSNGRLIGSIEAGVNAIPYYPVVDGTAMNLDQSYLDLARWPSWVLDNQLVEYTGTPNILKVLLSSANGNVKGGFNYYAMIKIEDKNNLYYLSSSSSDQDVVQNRGIPLSKQTYSGDPDFSGQVFGNLLLVIGGVCASKS